METITIDGTPGNAELQLGSPGDANTNRKGPGTAELQLGIPGAPSQMIPTILAVNHEK